MSGKPDMDMDRFRLRRFVEKLIGLDEVAVHDGPVPLSELGAHLDGNPKAVLFRNAGPEGVEVVGNVLGARSRVAAAFGVAAGELAAEVLRRLDTPQPVVEVAAGDAPVQEVVLHGEEADLTRLPVHLQHALDGAPYISAAIDFTVDAETGWTNVGTRRLMLRGRREAGIDLVAPSDFRAIYLNSVARGEPLPVSFAVGSHPVDYIAASLRLPGDEIALIGALRGEAAPVVKCATNDIRVPADAEMVLEGYLDPRGHVEDEGPYGEYCGYYGIMKRNPVFHLTAIAMRRDAMFQTVTISGRHLARTDTAQIETVRTEATVWKVLQGAVREPVAVCAVPASNGSNHVRVAINQRTPGEARNAIAAVFGSRADVKHVYLVDADIDVFSDHEMEWALSTRFQADRDLVVQGNFRAVPVDPSLEGGRTGAKAGFDLTVPFGKVGTMAYTVPTPPEAGTARFQTVRAALESEPMHFGALMAALGSTDGREIVHALDELRSGGDLDRRDDGAYALKVPGKE